ncbi:MAG TPA: hypothetical protein VGI61_07300 [Parafilimonas sp.]
MKLLLFICCSFLFITVTAQTNNSNISEVKTLNIKQGKANIGKIIINQAVKTQVYLASITQQTDSAGNYKTQYKFVPGSKGATFNFSISITFDKKLIRSGKDYFKLSCNGACTINSKGGYDEPGNTITEKGSVNSDALIISVSSHNPLYASIMGVDGKTF